MAVDPPIQAEFERNLTWKRSWPRCFLGLIATIEVLMGLVIFLTELFNILMEFWHMNVFGGIWASIIICINWILIYVTVCCTTTIRASTCAFIWNLITLLALGVLIVFDVIFILNPYTCILTPTCSTQPEVFSLNSLMQLIPAFKDYTTYDSKEFFLKIQVSCAGVAFIISLIYVFIFIACRIKIQERVVRDYPAPAIAPLPPAPPPPVSPPYHEYPVPQAPPYHEYPVPQAPPYHEDPVPQAPPSPWTTKTPYAPYPPY